MSTTIPTANMTLFRSDSAYYFNGEQRKRKGVLVTAIALIVLTFIFAGGLIYFNMETWQQSLALTATGVQGTAVYTRSDVDVTYTDGDSHRTYYFRFAFIVDGQRYEGKHTVDLITYQRGIPAGETLSIVYAPDNPGNVQVGDSPTLIPALLQSGGILLLVVGGIVAALYTMKDYNRVYDPLKDGRITEAVITEIVPAQDAVEIHFRYTNPFTKQQMSGTDRLSATGAKEAVVGLNVMALVKETQKVALL